MRHIILEPGDATRYQAVYGDLGDGKLFFAFNSGDDGTIPGFVWPNYLGYISLSYFMEKQGIKAPWTAGVAYLVLHHLLGRELDESDLQKEPLNYITAPGRLKSNWKDAILPLE